MKVFSIYLIYRNLRFSLHSSRVYGLGTGVGCIGLFAAFQPSQAGSGSVSPVIILMITGIVFILGIAQAALCIFFLRKLRKPKQKPAN
jgi:hypothetical protein